ncbi:MAG: OsmC family protein [Gammaproteobacteria bacterium WSBS_2016_MAG_OTU1]
MKISLSWQGDVAFVAENETAQRIVFDGAPDYGGKDLGMRPMEGVLSAAAACSAMDIALMLKKTHQTLRTFNTVVTATRAETIPSVFTEIHLHFILGGDISTAAAERVTSLSVEKYCSVLTMIQQNVKITHSYTIENIDIADNIATTDSTDSAKQCS